ncbi:angiopoietin-related protein 3 [Hyla sarda]|uniref:angiopoietin-related protein 3 n=1 Tax=Hyla sarda TaxID=327740 RepID=UPI0024C2FD60|nr:angiopoietin-related protein 3 [Hyla sarda]XP_056388879.1 angiopoietin-related protein 3 [Hyla sarda]XP_056388880.1 angiopoietin-related protein 3 [Hyla sarda]
MKLLILLLLPLVFSASIEKHEDVQFEALPAESKSRFAMLDDVRILANGLLQLGHGLKDFVHKTKGQINEIFQKLNLFDKSFYDLSEQTNEIREKEEELKEKTSQLQENNEELRNMSGKIYDQIEHLLQDKVQLQGKILRLEEKLNQISKGYDEVQDHKDVATLKQYVEQQDTNIQRLLKVVADQNVQLDHQNSQIKDLEEKIGNASVTDGKRSAPGSQKMDDPSSFNSSTVTDRTPDPNDHPRDCNDVYNQGTRLSGVYTIRPNNSAEFRVYCEFTTEAAWTVIQRRTDGAMDFNQTWEDYAKGFGDLRGEFWLGLQKIFSLSQQADYILHIELQDWKNNVRFVEYLFTLGNQDSSYTLQLSQVLGNIPSALPEYTPLPFSTGDHHSQHLKCPAETSTGGWWKSSCGGTNLNAKYVKPRSRVKGERRRGQGLSWKPEKGRMYSLRSTKMMLYRTELENFE